MLVVVEEANVVEKIPKTTKTKILIIDFLNKYIIKKIN